MTWMEKLRLILAMEASDDREDALAAFLAGLLGTNDGAATLAEMFLSDEEATLWILLCAAQAVDDQAMIATLN
jgi:hypothetical protein